MREAQTTSAPASPAHASRFCPPTQTPCAALQMQILGWVRKPKGRQHTPPRDGALPSNFKDAEGGPGGGAVDDPAEPTWSTYIPLRGLVGPHGRRPPHARLQGGTAARECTRAVFLKARLTRRIADLPFVARSGSGQQTPRSKGCRALSVCQTSLPMAIIPARAPTSPISPRPSRFVISSRTSALSIIVPQEACSRPRSFRDNTLVVSILPHLSPKPNSQSLHPQPQP